MIINNAVLTGSFIVNGVNYITNTPTTGSNTYVGTQTISGSTLITGSLQVTGSIATTGTITAQTLVVQTVTSSIVYSSGSNIFGNSQSNVQQMTGSLFISGSNVLIGTTTSNGFKFKVSNNGAEEIAINPGDSANLNNYVNYNRSTSTYIAANYLAATHSFLNGNVGIGTSSPSALLTVLSSGTSKTTIGQSRYLDISDNTGAANAKTEIGFGYTNFGAFTNIPAVIGFHQTSTAESTKGDLYFATRDVTTDTAPTERMRITSGGDINMNATSGNKLVTVKGQTGNGYYGEVRLGNVDHSAGIIGRHISAGNADLEFWTEQYSAGGYTKKMTITASGNIGAPTGTNIYNASDIRLKQNVTTITNGLSKINALNPVKFNWIDGFEPSEDGKDMLGFIAQEVQNVIPEAVENFSNNSVTIGETIIDNPLRVNEKFIIPVLVKAIQELKAENDTLKERLTALENK
jgi:hypothetical protein